MGRNQRFCHRCAAAWAAATAVALSGPIVLGVVLGIWPRRVPAAFAPTLLGLSLMSMVYLLGLSRLHIFASLAAALFGLSAARKRSAPLALACSTCVTVLAHGVLQRTTGFVAHEFDAVGLSLQSLTALLVGMTALCGSAVAFSPFTARRRHAAYLARCLGLPPRARTLARALGGGSHQRGRRRRRTRLPAAFRVCDSHTWHPLMLTAR